MQGLKHRRNKNKRRTTMEKKGSQGALQSKPVTTTPPGSGDPQLPAPLPDVVATPELGVPVPGLGPRLTAPHHTAWARCAAPRCSGPTHLWDVQGEGRLRLELRADWTHSLSSSCYQQEKRRKKKGKSPGWTFIPGSCPFCAQEDVRGLPWSPLLWGKCSWGEDLVKICKVL